MRITSEYPITRAHLDQSGGSIPIWLLTAPESAVYNRARSDCDTSESATTTKYFICGFTYRKQMMTRLSIAIGFAAALSTLSLLRPILAVAQVADTQSSAESALPANQAQTPTQAEVEEALKQAQEQEGRKLALVTQAVGYWSDPSTGLMWAAKDSGKDLSWKDAAKYCCNLRTAGYSDWRLANLSELQGIYDRTAEAPGLAGRHSEEPTAWHVKGYLFLTADEWSSSYIQDDRGHFSGYVYYFDFNEGKSNDDPTGWPYGFSFTRALCVRGSGDTLAVTAANHNPAADTPEKIAAINQALAKNGDIDAAYELGLAYLQGYGVQKDLAQAKNWFRVVATDPGLKSAIDLDAEARLPLLDLFELAETYRKDTPQQTERAAKMYVYLLRQTGHPEVRLAQMELGNLVLDGKYTAGNDARGRALNLEWARIIAQESLGQEEYKIAVDYKIGREYLPKNSAIWLRFCIRAAAYNIDLAQKFLAQANADGAVPNQSGFDDIAWTRLASDKQTDEIAVFKAIESRMTPQQHEAADAEYASLVQTHVSDGAYYSPDDPLRNPTSAELAAMPKDDPDVQLRRAFALETIAQPNHDAYREALNLYRTVRDRREMDIRFALGRDYLNGTNGLPRNLNLARYWFDEASGFGSQPAKALLATLASAQPN
jgi:TPR repeat protein